MAIPELTTVESDRFESWYYDDKNCELYIKYPPSKKRPRGSIVIYENIAPEKFEEGLEADSKGHWLNEIIKQPDRYPFRYVTMPTAEVTDEPEPAKPEIDASMVPEPIRAMALVPNAPVIVMPEILPPHVEQGEKPFNQVVTERAIAIAAAVPVALAINSAEAYKALGTALVVIRTERIAVEKALDAIARPMIDAKRAYDLFRNDVLAKYDESEKRLDASLQSFKRAEEARVREAEAAQRRENERKAREQAEAAAKATREANEAEANRIRESAEQRRRDADAAIKASQAASPAPVGTGTPDTSTHGLFGASSGTSSGYTVPEAKAELERVEADLKEADRLATAPVEVGPIHAAPVVIAKQDLKVPGLRKKSPLWRWRIPERFFRNRDVARVEPIRRNALRNPGEIPDEYWILDDKAVSGHVKDMDGVISIPQVEPYDANA
jgi:hypothetical protein